MTRTKHNALLDTLDADGRARLRVKGVEKVVGPGSLLFVEATSDHSFVEIEEDITLLVFFASGGPSGS